MEGVGHHCDKLDQVELDLVRLPNHQTEHRGHLLYLGVKESEHGTVWLLHEAISAEESSPGEEVNVLCL